MKFRNPGVTAKSIHAVIIDVFRGMTMRTIAGRFVVTSEQVNDAFDAIKDDIFAVNLGEAVSNLADLRIRLTNPNISFSDKVAWMVQAETWKLAIDIWSEERS